MVGRPRCFVIQDMVVVDIGLCVGCVLWWVGLCVMMERLVCYAGQTVCYGG